MELFIIHLKNIFNINPVPSLALISFLISCTFYTLLQIVKKKVLYINLILFILAIFFLFYFGPILILLTVIVLLASNLLSSQLLGIKNSLIATVVGFILLLQLFIILTLLSNFNLGFGGILLLSICTLIIFFKQIVNNIKSVQKNKYQILISNINIIDLWLLTFCFFLSSFPQSHWDAVQANLYNAKWYVLTNSFSVIKESISSLFPQNSIAYYSFFYKLGGMKGFQLSYLLPLTFFLILLKDIQILFGGKSWIRYIIYSFALVPIVVFEAANGYYDLFVLNILLVALYLLYNESTKHEVVSVLVSSFLIGFTVGIKYFPVIFVFLPPLYFIFFNKKYTFLQKLFVAGISISIEILSVIPWIIRTFLYTKSPFFPFLQYLFPTPEYWPSHYYIENDFMIQTTMSASTWLRGGFFLYPFLSYFKTVQFYLGANGFPGIVYILSLPLFFVFLWKMITDIRHKFFSKELFFILYSFFAFIIIGLITRYYRYLWPFQFIFSIFLLLYIRRLILKYNFLKYFIALVLAITFFMNISDIVSSYKYIPIIPNQILKPDYYQTSLTQTNPILFLNNIIKNKATIKILDASQSNSMIGRVHIQSRVLQCSWYWIGLEYDRKRLLANKNVGANWLKEFAYVIINNPTSPFQINTTCAPFITRYKYLLQPVYKDQSYIIYKVKND